MRAPDYATASIAQGSASFAAAARLLPAAVRGDVMRLYAWCRLCDDVIDDQERGHVASFADGTSTAARLTRLREKTAAALAGVATGEAEFDGFGEVARRHGITARLADDHLDGFAADVAGTHYATLDDLIFYCYGVAGSVGVMMALILGVSPHDADTIDRAADLGLAFQMTNIARDVVADAQIGRLYLPGEWLAAEGIAATPAAILDAANAEGVFAATARLVNAAEPYYRSASVGVSRLPPRTALAIAAAQRIYRAIGLRRVAVGPAGLASRVGTTRGEKLALMAKAALAARRRTPAVDRAGLWVRPPRP